MSPRDPVGQILAVKRAREQRATSRLHAARSAERIALSARDAADTLRSAHESARIEREIAIYDSLTGGGQDSRVPGLRVPGLRVQAAGAVLAVLQVRSTALDTAFRAAAEIAATSGLAAAAAQSAQATAARERSGAEALQAELAAQSDALAELQEEADMEDLFVPKARA